MRRIVMFVIAAGTLTPTLASADHSIDYSSKACFAPSDQKIAACFRPATPPYCARATLVRLNHRENCGVQT
jgi:hypothetical protein